MNNMQNQRNTRQRQVIVEELQMITSHPTAKELYHLVQKRLPKISLGTVYRNLELLARNKTIRKLEMSGSETRFDGEPRPHYHIRCTECGNINDLFGLPEDIIQRDYKRLDNYDVQGYHIEFYGVCPKCRSLHKDKKTIQS